MGGGIMPTSTKRTMAEQVPRPAILFFSADGCSRSRACDADFVDGIVAA
jgi:hypothetical protein